MEYVPLREPTSAGPSVLALEGENMERPSNLPPGVTNADIEDAQGDDDLRCRLCDDEIIDSGTAAEEAAAAEGLCPRCHEDAEESAD